MRTMETNEAGLIARILAGEKELLHELIRPYERMVYLTLFAIVKNEADAEGAAEESIEEQGEDHEGDFTPAPLTDWREIPLEALERKELREALRSAVAELPGIYRQVFILRDLEELNTEETAQALGINPGAVKVRLHRARMMLQKRLVPFLKTTAPARRGFFGGAL